MIGTDPTTRGGNRTAARAVQPSVPLRAIATPFEDLHAGVPLLEMRPPVRRLLLLALILASGACASGGVRPAPFPARPDSIESGDLRGPFDGRVLDAETDRPVAGALVHASWGYVTGTGAVAPAGWREHITSTDANGRYRVPRQDGGPGGARLASFRLVIYKRGYVAYRSDRRFEDYALRGDFAQKNLQIPLARWRPEMSHARHLRYIGGGATLAELTRWEVAEAVAERAGRKPGTETPVESEPGIAPPAQVLHAERLLSAADVKQITGFAGDFDARELGDEPTSERYDSLHLQARGRDETHDIALRLWRMPVDDARKHIQELLGQLPGAKGGAELGDRSLRTATPKGDILGFGYLDEKHGTVVLITCGTSQCRSSETLLMLMRKVKDRLDAELGGVEP